MNEALGRGYARIEAFRPARSEPLTSRTQHPNTQKSPPRDVHNVVYTTFLLSGVVFLLPYNSFIMSVDYFQHHYPDSTIMFDMSTVYIVSACVAVFINNMTLDLFSHNVRIYFGLFISLVTLVFVASCNIWWDGFSTSASYIINLFAVGVIAFGCTVLQASYYGLSSCLPPRYTQAVMAGESAAGFWVSMDRMVCKSFYTHTRKTTFIFFFTSIILLLSHCVFHMALGRNPLVAYYLNVTKEAKQRRRIQLHLNPNEDATLMAENENTEPSFGVLKLQSPPISAAQGEIENAFSFSNPVYAPNAPGTSPPTLSEGASPLAVDPTPRPSYKVDDVVCESPKSTAWRCFTPQEIKARWVVASAIYPHMVCIGLVYFTTVALYPGIVSEIPSCRMQDWLPVLLMAVFNFFDLLGKIAAAWPYDWSRSQLLMASGVRLLLVPLLLLCAAPRSSPHIVGENYSILFCVVLGFTNGLFGSVPMILAPSRVSQEHRELAGSLMTFSYNGGLLSGSLVSYLLLGMIGSPSHSACKMYPTPILPTVTPMTMVPNITITVPPVH